MYALENIFPPLPRVVRGKPLIFDADPKGEKLIYVSGNSVVIRSLENTAQNDMYTQHSVHVNVAKYSPSGFYIASADKNGKVRIWDTINDEHILKYEYQPLMGTINDLAWTSDNARIIVGGNSSSKFGAVFMVETGSSAGAITGMSKSANSVDFRPVRPYRAITGNDEGFVSFFEGPPFTFKNNFCNHAGFVNVVRYSLDGSFFVSGGADGKLFLHDGEGGEKICEVGSPAHEAGIYGVSFSRESPLCVSASADKSIKLWHVDGKSLSYVAKYSFENILTNMLLGCVWVGRKVATVSLSGSIHIFDVPSDSKSLNPPILSINGHKLHITCAKYNILNSHLITASSDGSMASWDISTGLAEMFSGSNGHSSQIQSMSLMDEYVITVGIDDLCVVSSVNELKHLTSMKLPSQPRCVQSVESKCLLIVVSCLEHMVLLELRNQCLVLLDQLEISLDFSTMSISRNLSLVVVGSQKLGTTSFHITPNQKLNRLSLVNATNTAPEVVAFSPNGEILATAEQDRSINLFSVSV
ncbi:Actin-interacting protein 1 [Schistosoma japonicum]|nr:Actin-interacting protein 1 [Schistosoma japonicum]KAH8875505.1 Actin-interacting protein 1 [Schistosoma japonicum]